MIRFKVGEDCLLDGEPVEVIGFADSERYVVRYNDYGTMAEVEADDLEKI